MEEVARAKLNLALHVRGRESDGYHRIETLFAFCEDGDLLRVERRREISLAIEGRFAASLASQSDNLVLRAARSLAERYAISSGAALTLDKRLPVASGIGGGSADAAAALRLLDRWWALGASAQALLDVAAPLGADVPACLLSKTLRGEGRGDRLVEVSLPGLSGLPVLLVNPGVAVATGAVFQAWHGDDGGPLPDDFRLGRNDLQDPAISIAPGIAEVLDLLSAQRGVDFVRMSGSGATCFALFDDQAGRDRAAALIATARPGWWTLATRLV